MQRLMYLLHLCWVVPAVSVMMLACSSEDIIDQGDGVTPGIVGDPEELTVYLDFITTIPLDACPRCCNAYSP